MNLSSNQDEPSSIASAQKSRSIPVPAPLIGALLLCLFWENLTRIFGIPSFVLPAPSDVMTAVMTKSN